MTIGEGEVIALEMARSCRRRIDLTCGAITRVAAANSAFAEQDGIGDEREIPFVLAGAVGVVPVVGVADLGWLVPWRPRWFTGALQDLDALDVRLNSIGPAERTSTAYAGIVKAYRWILRIVVPNVLLHSQSN